MTEQTATLFTYIISRDGKELKRLTDEISDFPALSWLQRNQSASFQWAYKYEGYRIEVINQTTKESHQLTP